MPEEQPEIRQLDARTVERIAAGEVVERPASVVKELVENSIDADASRVTVAVESGGIDGISVADDGVGMSRGALERAVEKHTTSKIGDIEDLESGVGTLGFRGEALHAIGAVSRLTITSRPRGGDRGTELTVEGGEITDVSPAGCPEGTTIELRDLFYNVPARRKYLKQESTEFEHVNSVVTSYALANPSVAVTLEHDGRETFSTTGQGNLRETVLSVYGREVAEGMVEIDGEALPDGPLSGVGGLVSDPEVTRATSNYISTFVNGRYVTAGSVRDAILDAYGKQLSADRYPFAVVFLEVDPGTVDVNVHPRKLEVRFADEAGVREQVQTAVEKSLLADGLLRSSAPRGQSAPDQTRIDPGEGSDGEVPDREDVADDSVGPGEGEKPADGAERATEPATDTTTETRTPTVSNSTIDSEAYPSSTGRTSEIEETDGVDETDDVNETDERGNTQETVDADGRVGNDTATAGESQERRSGETHVHTPADASEQGEGGTDAASSGGEQVGAGRGGGAGKFRASGRQERLGEGGSDVAFDTLPSMRVLGQLKDTYIVAETPDGMVLIDQHAADERINYERLRESFAGGTTTQALAEPVRVAVTASEAELFSAHADALARLGFHADLVEERTLELTTVPTLVAEAAEPSMLRDVLSELVSGEAAAAGTVDAAADALLADLACYPSITGNTSLTEGSVVDLLSRLDGCENPYACPHGRPVVIEIDHGELEARFERDYPGHS